MSSRKFDSGSTKRKKKSKEAAQLKKLKCAMATYLLGGSHSSTHNTNVPECSSVISMFTDDSEGNVKQQDILTESDEFKPGNNDATNIEPRSEQYVSTSEEINRCLPDLEGTESQSRQKTPDHVNVKIVAGIAILAAVATQLVFVPVVTVIFYAVPGTFVSHVRSWMKKSRKNDPDPVIQLHETEIQQPDELNVDDDDNTMNGIPDLPYDEEISEQTDAIYDLQDIVTP